MSGNSINDSMPIAVDSAAAGLVALLRFHRIPITADQLRHRFGTSESKLDWTALIRCAKAMGMQAARVTIPPERLEKIPMPALAEMTDGKFVILAGIRDGNLLVQAPLTGTLSLRAQADFLGDWNGALLLARRRLSLTDLGRPFGLSWFFTAVRKYRRILSEVLVASLFLQLLGLVSPLFFQVVVDKVLVHRGLSTLDVLLIGLVTVSLFETLLGGSSAGRSRSTPPQSSWPRRLSERYDAAR